MSKLSDPAFHRLIKPKDLFHQNRDTHIFRGTSADYGVKPAKGSSGNSVLIEKKTMDSRLFPKTLGPLGTCYFPLI